MGQQAMMEDEEYLSRGGDEHQDNLDHNTFHTEVSFKTNIKFN